MDRMVQGKVIYICENTPDGIFTAVYDAWAAHIPDESLVILADGEYTMELFAEYRYVETDMEKAVKVARSVSRKISPEAYRQIYAASLSFEEDKIMVIYRFLKLGFKVGAGVTDMHGREEVCRLFEICRNVINESHSFREFLRFAELENGVLMARIRPKNMVLPLMAGHFADRFPEEHFVIIDDNSEMGVFHEKGNPWFLSPIDREAIERLWSSERSREFERLWKTFFKAIAIEQRRNYKCQRTMCALRYRDYMLEFDN
ncbi:MAG: TIGR03915 family putative DNA repair protein [Lachnospiraceae bacterium]|nr:TIGR03915 family putative DNA repair protein [Lachnospiraceae bacterium]